MPCSHAIVAALKANVKVEGLVGDLYTINYLKAAYAEHVLPPVELDSDEEDTQKVLQPLQGARA
ncbi:hypothetical protein F2Q70_00029526 [Brassica cretica]|nr:hypothetical protein F2Q70_00029526 [Brassica cretica]